jgi:hypothetical protein
MTGFDAVKILSKKERRQRECDLRRVVASFVGRRVNLALRDGSVIVNVFLEPLAGKRLLRYRSTATGAVRYLALFEVDLITAVSLEAKWLQEVS